MKEQTEGWGAVHKYISLAAFLSLIQLLKQIQDCNISSAREMAKLSEVT